MALPESRHFAAASTEIVLKLVNCVPRPVTVPVALPIASSNTLLSTLPTVSPPFTLPMNTAPGISTRRVGYSGANAIALLFAPVASSVQALTTTPPYENAIAKSPAEITAPVALET